MKNLIYICICACSLFLTGCNKNDDLPEKDPGNYQTPLPAATTTGVGTFACYVDGKAYIAKKSDITAFYQFYQGKYGLSIRGEWPNTNYIRGISLDGNNTDLLIEGLIYPLEKIGIGIEYYSGSVFFMPNGHWNYTDYEQNGELKITKFDEVNGILSGTFWFDIKHPNGKIVEVREGRFDVKYAS